MRQTPSFAPLCDDDSVKPQDLTPQAAPIELDASLLSQISGAGPCGGWQSAPVHANKGPCGGW